MSENVLEGLLGDTSLDSVLDGYMEEGQEGTGNQYGKGRCGKTWKRLYEDARERIQRLEEK